MVWKKCLAHRWAPRIVIIWSFKPHKWLHGWDTWVFFTLASGVITNPTSKWFLGPPCTLLRYAIQANVTWHAGQEPGCLARGWFPLINVRSLGVLSQQVATEGRNENPVYTKWKVCWCTDVTDVTGFGPQEVKLADLCLFKVIGDFLLSTYGKSPWKTTIWGIFLWFFQPPNGFENRDKLHLEDHPRTDVSG